MDKGKWKSELSNYTNLSAEDLHSGFLNRLYTSRDFEAGLVGLMKERYEVNVTFPLHKYSNSPFVKTGPIYQL